MQISVTGTLISRNKNFEQVCRILPKSPVLMLFVRQKCLQSGFTLIELMVVLVIVAVMLRMVVLSLSPNTQTRLQLTAEKAKGMMQMACDQAAMRQSLVLIEPSDKQLQAWMSVKQNDQKVASTDSSSPKAPSLVWQALGEPLSWPEAVAVTWVLPSQIRTQNELHQSMTLDENLSLEVQKAQASYRAKLAKGWRCWPTGEMDAGEMDFKAIDASLPTLQLKWDSWGRFKLSEAESDEGR